MPETPSSPDHAAAREPLWREALGARLRDERRRRDETLGDVARRAGISLQYLSEIERGIKEPSSEMIAAVAGALELTLLDLTVEVSRQLSAPVAGTARGAQRGAFALAA
ncbi:helix-turn-helix transcriptional regulator [Aeromicrobium sp. YIM 150415]|uniref:helix-turn-helix domain-containing protein n=1 Tax=Aeromicrobium sp. YIM 150415 TaxID=2803912 RepID=UPI001965108E|nr:helix-turn-helix transcriptional regulator [Aeromicrobium sp. YIM 150415]MBM9462144.1 helix-turn-helix transcriptional regulator [Aeromicrobium sp. YIM 150415]